MGLIGIIDPRLSARGPSTVQFTGLCLRTRPAILCCTLYKYKTGVANAFGTEYSS